MTDEYDPDSHRSGLGFIQVKMWEEGDVPASDEPAENVLFPVIGGEHHALEGDVVTFDEHFQFFIDHHLSGECDCLGATRGDDDE